MEKPSILVVDDNPLIRNVLEGLLLSQNYMVHCSENGEEALEVLSAKEVDVIICDIMMPQMDGYELHSRVRSERQLSHIPFVFLTALGSEDARTKGQELGVDGYVVKPFQPRGLLSMIRGKIQRSRALRMANEELYDAYRKRVIHTLSHEFRTPLVAINTGVELLLDESCNIEEAQRAGLLQSIQRGGRRLERLVSDFMLIQQLEAGVAEKLFNERAAVKAARDVMDVYVATQESALLSEGFQLKLEDNSDGAKVLVYEPHIHDIIARLVSNSMKFSKEQREVDVLIEATEADVVFTVRDRGIGFNLDKSGEALCLFGQIDRERYEQQGSGFGLAIAHRYAMVSQGELLFENREGGGASVSLSLPRCKSPCKSK